MTDVAPGDDAGPTEPTNADGDVVDDVDDCYRWGVMDFREPATRVEHWRCVKCSSEWTTDRWVYRVEQTAAQEAPPGES